MSSSFTMAVQKCKNKVLFEIQDGKMNKCSLIGDGLLSNGGLLALLIMKQYIQVEDEIDK